MNASWPLFSTMMKWNKKEEDKEEEEDDSGDEGGVAMEVEDTAAGEAS